MHSTVDGLAQAYLGRDGTLLYVAGAGTDDRTLVWVDRDGNEELLDAPLRRYRSPRVSPDGDRIVVQTAQGGAADIHVFDVARTSPASVRTIRSPPPERI